MKTNNFRGEPTDVLAKTATLLQGRHDNVTPKWTVTVCDDDHCHQLKKLIPIDTN